MEFPGDNSGGVEQVLHDLNLCLCIPLDHLQGSVKIGFTQFGCAEQMNAAEDWRERRSEFMGDHCYKFILQAIGFLRFTIEFRMVDSHGCSTGQGLSQWQMAAGKIGIRTGG